MERQWIVAVIVVAMVLGIIAFWATPGYPGSASAGKPAPVTYCEMLGKGVSPWGISIGKDGKITIQCVTDEEYRRHPKITPPGHLMPTPQAVHIWCQEHDWGGFKGLNRQWGWFWCTKPPQAL